MTDINARLNLEESHQQ